jgi:hypothetical protein
LPGLGRKVFSAGEVLTAVNVQGYLMDQAVMVFASSAARSSALGTADTNEVTVYDGAAWQSVGGGGGFDSFLLMGA